jgi:hypothetical protein
VATTELEAAQSLLNPELMGEEENFEDEEVLEEEEDFEDEESDEDFEEEQDDEEDGDEEPELFTVSVDGTNQEVTLEELKRGYSGQQYVQKGMYEVSQQKKALEQQHAKLQQAQQQLAAVYQQLEQGGIPQKPVAPSKEQFANDPIGFMEAKLQYEDDVAQYEQKVAQLRRISQQQNQFTQQQQEEFVKQQYMLLTQAEPEFGDKEKGPALYKQIAKTAEERYGITNEELSTILDHRAYRVLKDAMAYHELQSNKTSAKGKAKKTRTRVARGGNRRKDTTAVDKQRRAQRQRLKKTGSARDAAALILNPKR